jgi:arsenate reductase
MQRPIGILFLCTGNSCRSQMAEGWARALHPGTLQPSSAGTHPGRLDPRAVRVMAEAGIDIADQRSKSITELETDAFDVVITVCDQARETCPVFPAARRQIHRAFDDPPRLARDARSEEEGLGHYRRVRDDIAAFVRALPATLAAEES